MTTSRPDHELTLIAAALARGASRLAEDTANVAHVKRVASDQFTLIEDLNRDDLERVALDLASLVAVVTRDLVREFGGDVEAGGWLELMIRSIVKNQEEGKR